MFIFSLKPFQKYKIVNCLNFCREVLRILYNLNIAKATFCSVTQTENKFRNV